MSSPSSNLAAYLSSGPAESEELARFELRAVLRPSLDGLPPGCVLVRALATSICGSDLFGRGGCAASPRWRSKTDYLTVARGVRGATGHEVVGEIVEAVAPCALPLGRRCLAFPSIYVRRVVQRAFREATGGADPSILPAQGGWASYFVSHECACLPLPESPIYDGFNPLWFVAAQPLGTILHAAKKMGSVVGLDVAIVGQGQNGLIMTQLLARMGARRVIALDMLEERLECSKKMKSIHQIRVDPREDESNAKTIQAVQNITEQHMCDIVVDMVGHQSNTIDLCASLVKTDGTVLLFGLPAGSRRNSHVH